MSLLLALTGGTSPDVTSTLAFTTDDITFAGNAAVTITSTLAFTTDDIQFAGTATETIASTLAFTTDSIQFDGVAIVTTNDVSSMLVFITDDVSFDGNLTVTDAASLITSTPGFKLTPKFRGETEEEKRLRREAQGILSRVEIGEPSEQLVNDAKDVIDQLKDEIINLKLKERVLVAEKRHAEMIRVQLAQEQLQSQIEEIDTSFVMMMIIAESY